MPSPCTFSKYVDLRESCKILLSKLATQETTFNICMTVPLTYLVNLDVLSKLYFIEVNFEFNSSGF